MVEGRKGEEEDKDQEGTGGFFFSRDDTIAERRVLSSNQVGGRGPKKRPSGKESLGKRMNELASGESL